MRKLNNFNIFCIILLWSFLCYIIITESQIITTELWTYLLLSAGFVFIPIWKHFRDKSKK